MKFPPVSMIVAMTQTGVIGNKGTMPWSLPRDMKRFKKLTTPSAVVMGPKTFTSIGKPLAGRLNIILTTNRSFRAADILIAHDPHQALELATIHGYTEFFVIGGAMVYTSFLPLANHLFITYVDSELKGDTHFPHWDTTEWCEVWIEKEWKKEERDSFPTKFAEFRRNAR